MKIAVDIDDVLANFVECFAQWHNATYGTNVTREDFRTYALERHVGCSVEEVPKRISMFLDSSNRHKLHPITGSAEGIDFLLQKGYELFNITARKIEWLAETKIWMRNYFPGKFDELHFAANPNIGVAGETKAEIALRRGSDIAIDDSPRAAMEYAEAGIPTILIDCPWNQGIEHEKIKRLRGWAEVTEFFKSEEYKEYMRNP